MATVSKGRTIGFGALIALISLPLGYLVLRVLEAVVHWLWVAVPGAVSGAALGALVLGVPALAGVLVAFLRTHGADGHNPMFGIAMNPIRGGQYPSIIGAIAVTLVGGLVLGPEVAMVSTGAVVGTAIASRCGMATKQGAVIGASAAIFALFVGPIVNGSFTVLTSYQFAALDLIGSVGVAAATAGVLTAGRFLSIGMITLRGGDRPIMLVLACAGFLVGVVALTYHLGTGREVALVLSSGESSVKQLLALGTAGTIGLTVAAKWLAYSVSMGGGFRGGPFFPAIYIGAGVGGIATLTTPTTGQGAVSAGITAAIVYLAHPKWPATLVIGVLLGMLIGGAQVIPLAVLAAAVAKALPGVRDATQPTGAQRITKVS